MLRTMATVGLLGILTLTVGCAELKELRKQKIALEDQLAQADLGLEESAKRIDLLEIAKNDLGQRLDRAQTEERRLLELVGKLSEEHDQTEQQNKELQELVKDLSGVTVEWRQEGNFIVLESAILFASGKADLNEDAKTSLRSIFEYLRKTPQQRIRVDGHTDGVDIKHSPWKDNFELSAARAHAVMAYLVSQGISTKNMYIVGYGPNMPRVQPEKSKDPVAENRRVEILLIPEARRDIEEILREFQK